MQSLMVLQFLLSSLIFRSTSNSNCLQSNACFAKRGIQAESAEDFFLFFPLLHSFPLSQRQTPLSPQQEKKELFAPDHFPLINLLVPPHI